MEDLLIMSVASRFTSVRLSMLVVAVLIVGLAGVVGPMISSRSTRSARGQALADMSRIARALDAYLKTRDTAGLTDADGEPLAFLAGPGELPSNNTFDEGPGATVGDLLGPISPDLPGADPWGRAYLVNLGALHQSTEFLMVLSAGPNGQVNTKPTAPLPGGDDLIIVLD